MARLYTTAIIIDYTSVGITMRYVLCATALISCCAGIAFFAWYHEIIICLDLQKTWVPTTIQQQTITTWYFKAANWHQEQKIIIIEPHNQVAYTHKVIEQWLTTIFNSNLIAKRVTLLSVAYNKTGSDLYLSFDHSPFNKQQSTYHKIMLINSLSKTLQENGIKAQRMHLLVNHEYLYDPHILCNYGLPVTGFINNKK